MVSDCGDYALSYNGEIYNTEELRLQAGEFRPRGTSDTEVLLNFLIARGRDGLSKINGMFAFAFFDRRRKSLLLARDRFGIKPLYFSKHPQHFFFGSEIKALLAGGHPSRSINTSVLHEYAYFGTPLGSRTFYSDIEQLLPGHSLHLNLDSFAGDMRRYWAPPSTQEVDTREAIANVSHLLEASIKRHLVSDVPVAVFLSGGIDSSAITAMAARHSDTRLRSYSVGFDNTSGQSELPAAASLAKRFDTDHHELHIGIDDVKEVLLHMTQSHDQPFSDAANIPLYLLCKALPEESKVVLQGDGGDEIFGGYNRYRWLSNNKLISRLARANKLIPVAKLLGKRRLAASRILDAFGAVPDYKKFALLLTEERQDGSCTGIFSPAMLQEIQDQNPFTRYKEVLSKLSDTDNPAQRMLHTDAQIILPDIFLPKVDRSTMAHGIETRVPFLDVELAEYVMSLPAAIKLPGGEQKGLLKAALRGTVPNAILDARKTGFSVPFKEWIKGDLGDWLLELMHSGSATIREVLNTHNLETMLQQHRQDQGNNGFLLYKSLILALWIDQMETHLDSAA